MRNFFVLLSFCSLLHSTLSAFTTRTDAYGYHQVFIAPFAVGPLPSATTPALKLQEPVSNCSCEKSGTPSLTEQPYTELLRAIYHKGYSDYKNASVNALRVLRARSISLYVESRRVLHDVVYNSLMLALVFALSLMWCTICLTLRLLWEFLLPVSGLMCIVYCTYFVSRFVMRVFGPILQVGMWLRQGAISALRLFQHKKDNGDEMSIPGFKRYSFLQKPPKGSIVEVLFADNSHAGYASCVRLYNGDNALLTASHVLSAGSKLRSTKTGMSVACSLFKPIVLDEVYDFALLLGPPNWEGLLGVKGAQFHTARQVAKGPVNFYYLTSDGEWECSNAEIVGTHDKKWVSVLSNTTKGHSGTPYFSGKTILGVHKGYDPKGPSVNLMVPIPALPGLTSPNHVFESPEPKGSVFSEDVAEEITRDFEAVMAKWSAAEARADPFLDKLRPQGKGSYKSKTGIQWEDVEDDGDERFHAAADSFSGKRVKPTRRRIRGGCPFGLSHPAARAKRFAETASRGFGSSSQCIESGGEGDRKVVREGNEEAQTKEARQAWRKGQAEGFRHFFDSFYRWEVCTTSEKEGAIAGFQPCGRLNHRYPQKPIGTSEWGKSLIQEHPDLETKTRGFGWPQKGAEAELKSLRLQAARWRERSSSAKCPTGAERERIIQRTVESYKHVKTEGPLCCSTGELSWNNFVEDMKTAVSSLELDAGVGVPLIVHGMPTHRGWVEDANLLPILAQMTFDRLEKLSKVNCDGLTAEELVQQGLCDPVRLFVKGEPHKQSKLDEGRYRLIMSISLVDQLVARVLFQNQNKREIALWRAIPSKPGMGLSTDGQVEDFLVSLSELLGKDVSEVLSNWHDLILPTDCSGFDWSVSDWMMEDEMEVRNRLTLGCTPLLVRLRKSWLTCILNSVLCLSDGSLIAQRVPGVQKSGSYNTSSSNSRIRVMAAYHCGASWAIAMGDDALESRDGDLSKYAEMGFKVEVSKQLEFCSHIFQSRSLAIPVNANKMIYKLIFGYNPECGNVEVVSNYLCACFSVLQELRHDQDLCQLLYKWLVTPVLPQKI
uniref:P1-P2 fusion protein n=1 Tax=Persimmon polerovirus TaxID=2590571 RepID=A0A5K7VWN4_9VIRU|nr:P1-P2 fusion protein [Persimmon polerovirus]